MMPRALIGCECSGAMRQALRDVGFDARSVDIQPAEDGETILHAQTDLRHYLGRGLPLFDLAIMHPECRYLAHSGVRWLYKDGRKENGKDPDRWARMELAADFYAMCWAIPCDVLAIENSEMHPYAKQALRDRGVPIDDAYMIQTWALATDEADNVQKKLHWLTRGLPKLQPVGVFDGSTARPECHHESPGPNRSKNRARTRPSVAASIAAQWGPIAQEQAA